MSNYVLTVVKIKKLCGVSQFFLRLCMVTQNRLFFTNNSTFYFKSLSTQNLAGNKFLRNFSEQRKPKDISSYSIEQDRFHKTDKDAYSGETVEKVCIVDDADKVEFDKDNEKDDYGEEDYNSALLDYYIKKVKEDLDFMDDDDDYYDLQESNQRVFFKIVDIWLTEIGPTRRGHRDFIETLLKAMPKFNVENEISAYIKLLDCFPTGKHLDIKRDHKFRSAFQEKFSEHGLGLRIFRKILINAVPNDKVFERAVEIFGTYSPATWKARAAIFWYPRWETADPHPMSLSDFKKLSSIEIGFYALRQMNPGIDCHYHNFQVDKSRCDETLKANQVDSVISVQTDKQISMLANHDPSAPVYVEGPYLTYCRTNPVRYYVMRCDPKKVEIQKAKARTTILTTKEWWVKFYGKDWKTGRKRITKTEETFLPTVDVLDVNYTIKKSEEIAVIERDTDAVEGAVYALACTDLTSQEALLAWIRGLVPENPILRQCTVVMRDEDAFLLNAPKTDPNESFYETVELPNI